MQENGDFFLPEPGVRDFVTGSSLLRDRDRYRDQFFQSRYFVTVTKPTKSVPAPAPEPGPQKIGSRYRYQNKNFKKSGVVTVTKTTKSLPAPVPYSKIGNEFRL